MIDEPTPSRDPVDPPAKPEEDYLAVAQRVQADFENYRKRTTRELAKAQERGHLSFLSAIIPALDCLDLALSPSSIETLEPETIAGFRLVREEMRAGLESMGVELFGEPGDVFSRPEHEAIFQQQGGGFAPGLVAEVRARGYRCADKVVRAARVVVAA